MSIRQFSARILIALAAWFGLLGFAQAAGLVYQGQICWQNVSSYDQVIVHFQPNGNSDWDSNMTVNGVTIASTGNGSSYAGQSGYVPGNSISLGWVWAAAQAGFAPPTTPGLTTANATRPLKTRVFSPLKAISGLKVTSTSLPA